MADNVAIKDKTIMLDDILACDADERYEIIRGELRPIAPVGMEQHIVAGNIYDILRMFTKQNKLRYVFMDGLLYLMGQREGGVKGALVPDVSFVRADAMPKPEDWDWHRPFPDAPTLAVEIMSPSDQAETVQEKVRIYFEGGTRQVWVVFPSLRMVHQDTAPKQVIIYSADEQIGGLDDVSPGLTFDIASIFAQN
ncbi:MAG: Uma2 family endonuclease [Anaerolineales bacterium]